MSLLNLPPELLRIIAMNLTLQEMFNFRESCSTVMAATSDVSFYSQYFTINYPNDEIELLYRNRHKISKWKIIVELFFKDNYKFAMYFFKNACKNIGASSPVIQPVVGSTLERLGLDLGEKFAYANNQLCSKGSAINKTSLKKSIATLRETHPELALTEQWNCFEDLFYAEFYEFFYHSIIVIKNSEVIELWDDIMKFAEKNDYKILQNKTAYHIINGIIGLVAEGKMKCDEGLERLPPLLQKLHDLTDTDALGQHVASDTSETLPGLTKLFEFLLKELVVKRRLNYAVFFGDFIHEIIRSLFYTIIDRNNLEQH